MKKIAIIFLVGILLSGCKRDATTLLKVTFFDVGQGDAALIQTPYGQNILIDGGPDDSVVYELDRKIPWTDKTIDLMILSHPHADHLNGQIDVMKKYKVNKILYSGATHTSPNYFAWLDEIKKQKIELNLAKAGDRVNLGENMYLEFYGPDNLDYDELNNTSLVFNLFYNQNKFLFTGDIEKEAQNNIMNNNMIKTDVLKIPHHGSKTSIKEFIVDSGAKYGVISSGKENQFGHPHSIVLEWLKEANISILRTDRNSTIDFVSDGSKITYKTLK